MLSHASEAPCGVWCGVCYLVHWTYKVPQWCLGGRDIQYQKGSTAEKRSIIFTWWSQCCSWCVYSCLLTSPTKNKDWYMLSWAKSATPFQGAHVKASDSVARATVRRYGYRLLLSWRWGQFVPHHEKMLQLHCNKWPAIGRGASLTISH